MYEMEIDDRWRGGGRGGAREMMCMFLCVCKRKREREKKEKGAFSFPPISSIVFPLKSPSLIFFLPVYVSFPFRPSLPSCRSSDLINSDERTVQSV